MSNRDPHSQHSENGIDPDPSHALSLDADEHPSTLARGTDAANTEISASPVPAPLSYEQALIGTVLGSYKVLSLLGRGGMGCVFRAKHTKLDRDVALKLLRSDYARRRDVVSRFFQEARTVNRIRHRNIVDVTDFVELPDGTTFIVMELLRGQRLGAWARSGVDLPRMLAVLAQVCEGLGAAHEVGVIHRDLKPDNIIVMPSSGGAELVKLLDFGVAKLLHRDDDDDFGFETAAGTVIGTPAYMSPEQAGGLPVDTRSDIYSLGAIMYNLFCGQPVFRARSFGEYVRKHLTELPTAPRATPGGAWMDPQLELVILRCLEKAPDRRFATTFELRDALGALGALGALDALDAPVAPAIAEPAAPEPVAPPAPQRNGRWPWLRSGAIAVVLGASGTAWYTHRTRAPVPAPAAAPAIPAPPIAAPVITPLPEIAPTPPPPVIDMSETRTDDAGPPKPARPRPTKPKKRIDKPVVWDIDRNIEPTDTLDPFQKKPSR